MFRIIFVLDLLKGKAVHAVRGERSKYLPVNDSKVCNSSDPLGIISSLRPGEVYIADLDRLLHTGDNIELIKKISGLTRTIVNIGVERIEDIEKCIEIAGTVILSTEASSLDLIEHASRRFPDKINVTVDIKEGRILTKDNKMKIRPEELIEKLNELRINDIIIIDLSKVGTGEGFDPGFLRNMVSLSEHNILLGGGVKDMDDINSLKEIGVKGALVATGVHNGKIRL